MVSQKELRKIKKELDEIDQVLSQIESRKSNLSEFDAHLLKKQIHDFNKLHKELLQMR